jgi:hypothetical protein
LASSEKQSSESQSTSIIPPTLNRTAQEHPNSTTVESIKSPSQPTLDSQPPTHNTHQSVGSLVFGGYSDSNNSSPAPPPSARGVQQPTQPHNESGHTHVQPYTNGSHVHSLSNGYTPIGTSGPTSYHPRQDTYVSHNLNVEGYPRRQMTYFGPPEGYSPSGTASGIENQRLPTYDPSTPRSFHGSQSSAPNEQDGYGATHYTQYATAVISNGSNGHVEDVRLYHQPRPKVRTGSQSLAMGQGGHASANMVQPPMHPAMDNLDGLIGYLQSQFAEPKFADYTLELRYSDDRATPVRIPGHNLIFARSPKLNSLMTAQARDSNTDGLTLRTLLIETEDRFLRSDGFWMAVQRLYGGPLLDPGITMLGTSHLSSTLPGTPADRFEIALGYAASGHILQMPPVVHRGIDIACQFVNWLTLEKALDFALDGGLDSQWTLEDVRGLTSLSTYGPDVNRLIHSALNFIITMFPPTFELDTMVPDPTHNRRFPLVIDTRPITPNPRLSAIKFGDHPSEDIARTSSSNSSSYTLSKILLNLPYQLLKYILESPHLGNVHGLTTATLRQKVMHSIIEERERRRNTVLHSKVPNSERTGHYKQWNSVGWKENIVPPFGAAETSRLTRTWVNFLLPESS